MCHHHNVVRLEEISLRQSVGAGRYQELRDVLLLRVQISRLKIETVEVEEPDFSCVFV